MGWEAIADHPLSDIKSMVKVFWRWMKSMDESKPIYPPEVSWFTEGRFKSITVTRSDLLTDEEADLLTKATEDAQNAAFVKVLDDAGGRSEATARAAFSASSLRRRSSRAQSGSKMYESSDINHRWMNGI